LIESDYVRTETEIIQIRGLRAQEATWALQQQLACGRYERERGQISGPNLQLARYDSAQGSPQRSASSSTRSEQGKESESTIVPPGRASGLSDVDAANDDEVVLKLMKLVLLVAAPL